MQSNAISTAHCPHTVWEAINTPTGTAFICQGQVAAITPPRNAPHLEKRDTEAQTGRKEEVETSENEFVSDFLSGWEVCDLWVSVCEHFFLFQPNEWVGKSVWVNLSGCSLRAVQAVYPWELVHWWKKNPLPWGTHLPLQQGVRNENNSCWRQSNASAQLLPAIIQGCYILSPMTTKPCAPGIGW